MSITSRFGVTLEELSKTVKPEPREKKIKGFWGQISPENVYTWRLSTGNYVVDTDFTPESRSLHISTGLAGMDQFHQAVRDRQAIIGSDGTAVISRRRGRRAQVYFRDEVLVPTNSINQ